MNPKPVRSFNYHERQYNNYGYNNNRGRNNYNNYNKYNEDRQQKYR